MRRLFYWMLTAAGLAVMLCGCGAETESRPWSETVEYSNLNDPETRERLDRLLTSVTTDEGARQVFFEHVDQINSYLEPEELTDGFERNSIAQPKYDPYDIQARWEADQPYFLGYNCRITAFSLFQEQMQIGKTVDAGNQDSVMMDMAALEEDPSAFPSETQVREFQTFYAGIPTEDTKDIEIHLENIKKSWAEREISFNPGNATLISVFFHDQLDGDQLSVGHTGILMEEQGQLYFLEKLSFQEPYQLVKVSSRGELSDYLMTKYDVEFNQPVARPMILENDHLIEDYRPRAGS